MLSLQKNKYYGTEIALHCNENILNFVLGLGSSNLNFSVGFLLGIDHYRHLVQP